MAGFTLIELLLAMAIFGVISAAAFGLMAQHQPLFNQQQGLAALNISKCRPTSSTVERAISVPSIPPTGPWA